jgi:hypothetical protein
MKQVKGKEATIRPLEVRLPGFLIDKEQLGLGDAIKRVTYAMGMPTCGGCNRRAAILNRLVTFKRGTRGETRT